MVEVNNPAQCPNCYGDATKVWTEIRDNGNSEEIEIIDSVIVCKSCGCTSNIVSSKKINKSVSAV